MGEKGSESVRKVDRSGWGVVARLESAAVTTRPSVHIDAIASGTIYRGTIASGTIASGTICSGPRVMDARIIVPFSIAWATHADRRISAWRDVPFRAVGVVYIESTNRVPTDSRHDRAQGVDEPMPRRGLVRWATFSVVFAGVVRTEGQRAVTQASDPNFVFEDLGTPLRLKPLSMEVVTEGARPSLGVPRSWRRSSRSDPRVG